MYDNFMPPHSSFRQLEFEDIPQAEPTAQNTDCKQHEKPPGSDLLSDLTGGIRSFLGNVFNGFSPESLDSGDILLLLIILFLYLEGDNLDLVIALGVMFLLSFGTLKPPSSTGHEECAHPAE